MTQISTLTPPADLLAEVMHRPFGLFGRHGLIATYRARRLFRQDLERVLTDNPHLISDMGLMDWQAKAEIAKPFWQA